MPSEQDRNAPRPAANIKRFKTCDHCSMAKITCRQKLFSGSCDRCYRLQKECHYRKSRRKVPIRKINNKQIKALEEQLSQLTCDPRQQSSSRDDVKDIDVVDQGLLSLEQAEFLLEKYRTQMAHHFPFFVPPRLSTQRMRSERPFVFLAIVMVALHDSIPLQRMVDFEIRQIINQCMESDRKITFDILQGMLIYLSWAQYHTRPRRYLRFISIAVDTIFNFELNKAPQSHMLSNLETRNLVEAWGQEKQHAVMGCYYLISSTSILLQKSHDLPFTENARDCCKSLIESATDPLDRYLCHIIRLQLFIEKVDRLSLHNSPELHKPGTNLEQEIARLRNELNFHLNTLPFPLEENYLFFMKFHTAQLYLCETSLPCCSLETLLQGMKTAKRVMNVYLTLPPYAEMAFTNAIWVEIGFIMVLCVRLLNVASEEPIKHKTISARQDLNLPQILHDSILRAQKLVSPDAESKGHFFLHTVNRLKGVQEWYQSLFEDRSGVTSSALTSSTSVWSPSKASHGTATDILDCSLPHDFSEMSLE